MTKPRAPDQWPQVRTWLIALDHDERRYVIAWLKRYTTAGGGLTMEAISAKASEAYTRRPIHRDT